MSNKLDLKPIQAFRLDYLPEFDKKHLGKLINVFQEKFPTYSLVPIFYAENKSRGKFKLYVIHSLDHNGIPNEHHDCYNDDFDRMHLLVHGFILAVR